MSTIIVDIRKNRHLLRYKRLTYGGKLSALFEEHLRLCLYMPLEYDFSAIIGSSA